MFTDQEKDNEADQYYFNARYYRQNTGRFNSADPVNLVIAFNNELESLTGKKQAEYLANPQKLNTYTYALNNPIIFIDPFGLDSYVYYDPDDFSSQAQRESERLDEKYGEPVYMLPITTDEQFKEEWSKMDDVNDDIDEVTMLFHGNATDITINYDERSGKGEYLTINESGKTSKYGNDATYIGSLGKKNIRAINFFVCQSGNIDQANLASTFAQLQNTTMYAWDGPMAYTNNYPRVGRLSGIDFMITHGRRPYGLVKYDANGQLTTGLNYLEHYYYNQY